jgi:hypothetical protein
MGIRCEIFPKRQLLHLAAEYVLEERPPDSPKWEWQYWFSIEPRQKFGLQKYDVISCGPRLDQLQYPISG